MDEVQSGGKARNLRLLASNNFNVPKFWVISPACFSQLKKLNEEERMVQILCYLDDQWIGDVQHYAVRSSASVEDGSHQSFAGLFETRLYVTEDQLWNAIQEVHDSLESDRVNEYVRTHGLTGVDSISIIIQEMIPSEVSGVAFGANPLNGAKNECLVNAVFGLGEGLVSGRITGDQFVFSGSWSSTINDKKEALIYNGSMLVYESLSNKQSLAPTLNTSQLEQIRDILYRLEKLTGAPQDIEFAFVNNRLFLLQTRPITTLSSEGEYTLWDNSNIVESYPGITTPLTYSFISVMYDQAYRQLLSLMGVTRSQIQKHKDVFANTLGLVRGRVYYNLLSWYKMLAMIPGYALNAEFMENMMGVKERFELKDDYQVGKNTARLRILWMVFRMIVLQFSLPGRRRRFQAHLDKTMAEYAKLDFDAMPSSEIINRYNQFEQTLLSKWKAPLINDFFSMIWFGLLKKFCEAKLPEATNIHNDLLCGSEDIISVEPIHETLRLASLIRENKSVKTLFEQKNSTEIWDSLQAEEFEHIFQPINAYIIKFGERCVGELKLETISYSQDPTLFIEVLRAYIKNNVTNERLNSHTNEKLRYQAEEKMRIALKGKRSKIFKYKLLLKQARAHVSARENLRFERTRGFGMVRRMFTHLGLAWENTGVLDDARDIFYLELSEIKNYREGENLKTRAAKRKQEFSEFARQKAPSERFSTYGNDFSDARIFSTEKLEDPQDQLRGIGCCPGQVRGKARVVYSQEEIASLGGDILITTSTDPGWVTLFPSASAIIVERGSLLSHSAIVSREMGIPCIVGVDGLLRSVSSGDEIWMDGSTGQIQITRK